MDPTNDEESDFHNSVIENLVNIFGHFISKEVITTLVESYGGDLNLCIDAITQLTNNGNMIPKEDTCATSANTQPTTPVRQTQPSAPIRQTQPATPIRQPQPATPIRQTQPATPISQTQPTNIYARTAQSRGAIPRVPQRTIQQNKFFWTDQIRNIVTHHNNGFRVMIILRGLPGSGKSHLARLLVENLVGSSPVNYNTHIFSSDDYFMVRGKYQYDKSNISYAHSWNQNRVRQSAVQALSPIIVDNTNIEIWEMRPYVVEGVNNGYIIEVIEPMTPWAKKPKQLFNMNIHNVPLHKIKRMLENFEGNVCGQSLIRSFGLNYSSDMVPPIRRLIPAIQIEPNERVQTPNSETKNDMENILDEPVNQLLQSPIQPEILDNSVQESAVASLAENAEMSNSCNHANETELDSKSKENELSEEEKTKQRLLVFEKKIEELQKFEEEWEKGEKWEESDATEGGNECTNRTPSNTENNSTNKSSTSSVTYGPTTLVSTLESKPPREKPIKDPNSECPDWRYISLFMPPWNNPDEEKPIALSSEIPIEKSESSTCVELNDTNLSGNHKIITATPRNINEFYVAPERERIPNKRMLDKSTMTNDGIIMTVQCPQKEKHFIAFRNLFKHIKRESLRYIFDNCCGDVNWAVENILGAGANYELKSAEDGEVSDAEDTTGNGSDLSCTCLAKYEIIPNVSKAVEPSIVIADEGSEQSTENTITPIEKKKRVVTVSLENIQLKRQIEQNVVIADNHYSEHSLKIRKFRRGEFSKPDDISEQPSTSGAVALMDSSNSACKADSSDEEDSLSSSISESDRIVNIDLGSSFIKELDCMFGRKDMEYPENIRYNISIPTSLLNEINALWIESMMYQLDENSKKSALMLKQDEALARQLQQKEKELMLEGKEPDVPDFKEIMDLEFALHLHMKDVSEWRNNIPTDLAAKMTHEKLFNLFPEVKRDTLLEMLMAHDNNFKATVEVLLISLGREEILETENGLNKFVMEKELQRQERILAERKKALSEAEWPFLKKDEKVDMSIVQGYRDTAEKHLIRRNMQLKKAEDYIQRGMIQVANYCSEVANFHKSQYEQANSMAVATLIQYHSDNNSNGETVDLHYFRVKEAMEALDLFIDRHIQKLRESNKRSIVLYFITGRGLHSPGLPKVKPACIKRLAERGLTHEECNPGLLRSRVSQETKLTYQIP